MASTVTHEQSAVARSWPTSNSAAGVQPRCLTQKGCSRESDDLTPGERQAAGMGHAVEGFLNRLPCARGLRVVVAECQGFIGVGS